MIILAKDRAMRSFAIIVPLLAVGMVGLPTWLSAAESPIDVSNRKQLMIDKRFIADSKDISPYVPHMRLHFPIIFRGPQVSVRSSQGINPRA